MQHRVGCSFLRRSQPSGVNFTFSVTDVYVGCHANAESEAAGIQRRAEEEVAKKGRLTKCVVYLSDGHLSHRPRWVWGPIFSYSFFALPAGLILYHYGRSLSVRAHTQVHRECPQSSIHTPVHIMVAVPKDNPQLCHSFLLPLLLPSLLYTRHPPIGSVYR